MGGSTGREPVLLVADPDRVRARHRGRLAHAQVEAHGAEALGVVVGGRDRPLHGADTLKDLGRVDPRLHGVDAELARGPHLVRDPRRGD
jgi:hypothetical protein